MIVKAANNEKIAKTSTNAKRAMFANDENFQTKQRLRRMQTMQRMQKNIQKC